MSILDDNGNLLWDDIQCTVPAYRGPVPEMEGPSEVALNLRSAEIADCPGVEELFA